jgi:hypothetical protein
MFLSKLFRRESEPAAAHQAKGIEHLAPTAYFTDARIDDLHTTFDKLGIRVNSITPLDQ